MKIYSRICPVCKKIAYHKNYHSLWSAKKHNKNCKECGLDFRRSNKEKKDKLILEKHGVIFQPRIDLTGKIINCWEVIDFCEKRGEKQAYYWNVKCVNCGIIVQKNVRDINKAYRCRHCKLMPQGQSGFNELFCLYNRNAKIKKRKFDLTEEQFKILTSSNCYYCNAKPSLVIGTKKNITTWGYYISNGIDRKDNSIGYIENNCVPCCAQCNRGKSDRGLIEFENYLINIYENSKRGMIPFLLEENN